MYKCSDYFDFGNKGELLPGGCFCPVFRHGSRPFTKKPLPEHPDSGFLYQ